MLFSIRSINIWKYIKITINKLIYIFYFKILIWFLIQIFKIPGGAPLLFNVFRLTISLCGKRSRRRGGKASSDIETMSEDGLADKNGVWFQKPITPTTTTITITTTNQQTNVQANKSIKQANNQQTIHTHTCTHTHTTHTCTHTHPRTRAHTDAHTSMPTHTPTQTQIN